MKTTSSGVSVGPEVLSCLQVFPVKRKLLRPCIALTAAVRADAEGPPSLSVDVGTLAFDRHGLLLSIAHQHHHRQYEAVSAAYP